MIIGLAAWWVSAPQLARMLTAPTTATRPSTPGAAPAW